MPGAATASPPAGRRSARAAARSATTGSPTATGPAAVPGRWPDAGRRLAAVPIALLLWLELLATAVLVAVVRRDPVTVAVAAVLVLGTVVATAGRWQQVPLHRLTTTWWRFTRRTRRARRRPGAPGDPRLAAFAGLLPRLHVESAPLRADRRFGVAFDGEGWAAAVEIEPPPAVLGDPAGGRGVPVQRLASLLTVDDIQLSAVQLVTHTVPAPAGWLAEDWLPRVSYERIRPTSVAGLRQTWLVLRLDAQRGRSAVDARGGGVQGAHRTLKRAVGRAVEVVQAEGLTARALDDAALRDVLAVNLTGAAATPDAPAGVESWTAWDAGGLGQVTWWVAGWPGGPEPVEPLLQLVQGTPAIFGVASLSLHATGRHGEREARPAARLLLRVGARADATTDVAAAVEEAAAAATITLRRLDGEHGPGVRATLPLGGGSR